MNGVERGNELETRVAARRFARWARGVPGRRARSGTRRGTAGSARGSCRSSRPGEEIATRDAGKKVMQAFKHAVPTMIGGAADLVESTKTEFEGGGLFSDRWSGRNIAFGIREHAMGSIVNGIGVHGGCVKPYGSTFLIFSDYMRPAVRLVRADEAAGGLGLDARLGRARRGRPDAPARRDVRRAARDPGALVHAPGRRERDRRTRGRSRSSAPTARSRSRSRARRSPTLDRSDLAPASGSSAARTRSGSRARRPT